MKRIANLAIVALAVLGACTAKEPQPQPTGEAAAAGPATTLPTAAAEGAGIVSRYTSLKECTVIKARPDEDWSTSRCKGEGDYDLIVNYADARDALDVVKEGRKIVELKLYLRGGGGFNALGDTVEWRGTMAGDRFDPSILIVRNKVHRSPDQPTRTADLLEVVDLKRGCSVASIEPQPGQNEAARALADGGGAPCLKEPA